MAPFITERIVLKEEVVVTVVKNQTIRIINPIGSRSEMFLWPFTHVYW